MSTPREQTSPTVQGTIDVRQPGMAGMNTIVDQHDIKDTESPNLLNTYFDQGVIGVRPGMSLYASKPSGESGSPLQLAVAKTCDGVNYLLSIYTSGSNTNDFYVRDTVNNRWVSINGLYSPVWTKTLYFGSQNWNMAYGDDRIYFGNKYDDIARWRISFNYLSILANASDSTLTLQDASRFNTYQSAITAVSSNVLTLDPSPNANAAYENDWEKGQIVYYIGTGISGLTTNTLYYAIPSVYTPGTGNSCSLAASFADAVAGNYISISGSPSGATLYKAEPIVVYDGSTYTQAIYYLRSGNVLTLTVPLGTAYAVGASVCPTLTDRPSIPKGNILNTYQARFVSTGGFGTENTVYLSRINEPEDYIPVTDDISSGGFQIFNDGAGGIVDVKNFGEFLIVEKSNGMARFDFTINQDLSAQISQVTPVISGIGMGPVNLRSNILAMNSIYYPSGSSGFVQLSPLTTGTNSSTGFQVISYNINNIYPNYDFSNSRGVYYKNKIFWTAQSQTSQNIVWVYDTIRQAWTKFDSWNPADMAVTNDNNLYILSEDNGNIYQAFDTYADGNNPYNAYYYTKLSNLGSSFLVKTIDAIYVEGYMTQSTTLYADVLYNERGKLFTTTYKLVYGAVGFQFTNVNVGGLGQFAVNQVINDSVPPDQIQNFGYFRTYLSVPISYGLFAVQVKFYSKAANSVWFLTGWGTKPIYEDSLPPTMRLDPLAPINYFSQPIPSSGGVSVNGNSFHVETPQGSIDGVNDVYTVLNIPKFLVLNGSTLFAGTGYTLVGLILTLIIIPEPGSVLRSLY